MRTGRCGRRARSRRDLLALAVTHPGLDAAVGVSSGLVVAGNVGAEQRYEYTVIGDPVNEAARLTEAAKHRLGRVLASDESVERGGRRGGPVARRRRDVAARATAAHAGLRAGARRRGVGEYASASTASATTRSASDGRARVGVPLDDPHCVTPPLVRHGAPPEQIDVLAHALVRLSGPAAFRPPRSSRSSHASAHVEGRAARLRARQHAGTGRAPTERDARDDEDHRRLRRPTRKRGQPCRDERREALARGATALLARQRHLGGGVEACQPTPGNHTSAHACASLARTS